MITLYSGTPGSGKSFHSISIILRALGWGRMVISNFPITFTKRETKKGYDKRFYYWPNEEITIENLIIFALDQGMIEKATESQCLVVIDEAGGRFNCRDFAKSDRRNWIDFFSQHRKIGYDFLLVAQNDRMLDRQIRGYIETEKKHRKANNFGPFAFLPFTLFVAVEYWYTAKQRVGSEFFLFRKKIADRYDSMRMFSGFTISPELIARIEEKRQGKSNEVPEGCQVSVDAIFTEDEGE
jgi:zona occludens toxin